MLLIIPDAALRLYFEGRNTSLLSGSFSSFLVFLQSVLQLHIWAAWCKWENIWYYGE